MVRYKTLLACSRHHSQTSPALSRRPPRPELLAPKREVVRWFISPTKVSLSSRTFAVCDDEGNNRGCLHACPTVTGSSSRGQRPEFRQVKIRAAAVLCRHSACMTQPLPQQYSASPYVAYDNACLPACLLLPARACLPAV